MLRIGDIELEYFGLYLQLACGATGQTQAAASASQDDVRPLRNILAF